MTVTRSYTAAVWGLDSAAADAHLLLHSRLVDRGINWLATIRAAYRPPANILRFDATADREQVAIHRCWAVAAIWFPAETGQATALNSGVHFGPAVTDVAASLTDHLTYLGCTVTEIAAWLSDTSPVHNMALREGAIRVDRAGSWRDLELAIRANDPNPAHHGPAVTFMDAMSNGAATWIEPPGASTTRRKSPPNDFSAMYRNLVSRRLGQGSGKNFSASAAAFADLASQIVGMAPGAAADLIDNANWIDKHDMNRATKTATELRDGRCTVQEAVEKLNALAADRKKKVGAKDATWWYATEMLTGQNCLPAGIGTTRAAVPLAVAAARLRATQSAVENQIRTQRQFLETVAATTPLDRWMETYCDERGQALGLETLFTVQARQLGGLDAVIAGFTSGISARATQAGFKGKFGDIAFFERLQEEWAIRTFTADDVRRAAHRRIAIAALADLKLPSVRHPDEQHPAWVGFAANEWGISRRTDEYATITLWSYNGPTRCRIRTVSARLQRDLASGIRADPSASPGSRNDRLGRATAARKGPLHVSARVDSSRLQLSRTARGWRASFAVQFEPVGPGLDWENRHGKLASVGGSTTARKSVGDDAVATAETRPAGFRILGVDRGLRLAGAWAVWETVTSREVNRAAAGAGVQPPDADSQAFTAAKVLYRRVGPDSWVAPWARLDATGTLIVNGGPSKPTAQQRKNRAKLIRLIRAANESALTATGGYRTNAKLDELPIEEAVNDVIGETRRFMYRHRLPALTAAAIGRRDQGALAAALAEWWRYRDLECVAGHGSRKLGLSQLLADVDRDDGKAPVNGGRGDKSDLPSRAQFALLAAILVNDDEFAADTAELWGTYQPQALALVRACRKLVHGGTVNLGTLAGLNSNRTKPLDVPAVSTGLDPRRSEMLDKLTGLLRAASSAPTPTFDPTEQKGLPDTWGATIKVHRANMVDDLAKQVASAAVGAAAAQRCHAIAIEDLNNLRTKQGLRSATNNMLKRWKRAEVEKFIGELAELHGYLLFTVRAEYTSQDDVRTGERGVRARLVHVNELTSDRWKTRFQNAAKRIAERTERKPVVSLYDTTLIEIEGRLAALEGHDGYVFMPERGGWAFFGDVSLLGIPDSETVRAHLLDADVQAGGNIGLAGIKAKPGRPKKPTSADGLQSS